MILHKSITQRDVLLIKREKQILNIEHKLCQQHQILLKILREISKENQ